MARAQSANEHEWFHKALNEMKELPVSSFNEEGEVFQNIYFQEHLFYINHGEFEKAEALVPIIEEGLVKYEAKINKARRLAFQFNIMIMFFIMHRFKDALKWTEPLLDDNSEIKQEQKFVTTLLLPIIHFELGHVDLVDSFTRSAYRLLQKKKRLHDFEKLVVKYLTDMPLSSDKMEFRTKLKAFSDHLDSLLNDPNVKITLGMEEMSLWAKSHLLNKKMSEIIEEELGTIE
jgi:tetratricopeptide (TPR) repeat protein